MAKTVFDIQRTVFAIESMIVKIEGQAQMIAKLIQENEQLTTTSRK
ncbi:hypothetical protein HNQ34_000352 [Anoxybacillus tepidamans]|uniref:Uncharacterized protein n=1 Tax=Anoxybacteroides tepidamans TaxID=265948 RepID=A0A7W8IMM1_9BACL|nr:hypothetical protein [Anoxybacillus tepidamans]MBB5323275.1 hypothetical protein [Anoxybacillus tepidamans]